MNECCIVNVSMGGWYPKGQDRLVSAAKQHSPNTDFVLWRDELPPGCPSHKDVPYAFKPYAVKQAMDRGYRYILWLDSAVVPAKNIAPIWDYIKQMGHYMQFNYGWSTGQWCTDAALISMGITRDEAFKMRHLMACILGFDTSVERTKEFITKWYGKANDGVSFLGPWNNNDKLASAHEKVLGHRHDQTIASILSIQLGMEWIPLEQSKLTYMPHGSIIKDHVLFTSCGGA